MPDSHLAIPSPRRTASTFWLVGLEGKARKVRMPIQAAVLVGRATYNHVVLDDARLSRQHARFAPEREGCVVYDLNSVNGTFVNDVPVKRHVLAANDVVRIGPYRFRIETADDRQPEEPAADDLETPTMPGLEASRPPESVSKMLSAIELRDSAAWLPAHDLMQLEDAYEKLGTLYGFMQAISKTIDRHELVELIAARVRDVYPSAVCVSIHLRSSRTDAPDLGLAHFLVSDGRTEPPRVPDDVRSAVLQGGMAILTRAPEAPGGTDMYAPMIDRGEVLGLIHVCADRLAGSFSRADLDLLKGMASPAAIMLQNTRMHEQSLAQDRLRYDLSLAAQIQKSFLPREVVSVEGVELFAEYRAAYTIGGDFYDVFWVGPDRLAVFIGDIAGKGVAAALLMARISSELRATALAHVEPVAVLATMNRATIARDQPELFFTAIYLTIDVRTGEVHLANAGHPMPYWCRANGRVEAVTEGAGCAVGILDDPAFAATSLHLAHGDSLLLYTDGVVEAASADGRLFGATRLEACLMHAGSRPPVIAESVLRDVEQFAMQGPPNDDLTLFICHRSIGKPASLQPRRRSSSFPSPMPARSKR